MKKIEARLLVFLMCIFLAVPQPIVALADTNTENLGGSGVDSKDGGGTGDSEDENKDGDSPDGDKKQNEDEDGTGDSKKENKDGEYAEGSDDVEGDEDDLDLEGDEDNLDLEGDEIEPELLEVDGEFSYGVMMLGLAPEPPKDYPDVNIPTAAHGSGSYQLNENGDDYRFYTEYFVKPDTKKSISTAGIDRRTAIKVYAKAGEIILFGSSVSDSQIDESNQLVGSVTGKDIVITTPNGTKVCEDVLLPGQKDSDNFVRNNGLGYIKNPKQEMNGPMVNSDNANHPDDYYVPLQYEVEESGVYTFEFHSVTGFNPNSASSGDHPSPQKASADWAQGKSAVAAWDVTVVGKNGSAWEVKSGRAWADYLALTTGGGAGIKSDLNVHVLTHDGFQYKVDFEKAVPYGFIFFANNTGFMTAVSDEDGNVKEYVPIYHSFYDSTNDLDYMTSAENICLHKPNEADTATEETYKIFFNAPSGDLNGVTYKKNGRDETIKTTPGDVVEIKDLTFYGGGDDSHQYIARAGHGGYFSFTATGEAIVSITLDLRKAILDSTGKTMQGSYAGSGIVEITMPVVEGSNSVYWDGKDTDGIVIPAGIYGDNDVVLATEVKRGELHFPVIDMEGLEGGLQVQRINGTGTGTTDCYNLYYNNNPLAYGTIEGNGYSKKTSGSRYVLSDGTMSYKAYTDRGDTLSKYFTYGPSSISTLVKDDLDYLSKKFFGVPYAELPTDSIHKAIIDAEFGKEQDTFHFAPVNSSTTSMKFNCAGYDGGGNQSGIDAWTYYTQGIDSHVISFAIMDTNERGMVKGQIFYDANISCSYDAGDSLLPGVKVRLIGSDGKPVVHEENLPCFDDEGRFIYEADGTVKHELKEVKFEAVTDSTGTYRFTGVPYSTTQDTTYYVQVLLTDVKSEAMRYTCTTSQFVKDNLKTRDTVSKSFIPSTSSIDGDNYGSDGNALSSTSDLTKIYGYKYDRTTDGSNETVFAIDNAQSVTFLKDEISEEHIVNVKEFKKIGYSSTVPEDNQVDYKLVKKWGTDSHNLDTHKISDGLIVELWVWNDKDVHEENEGNISRRTGALVDTQILMGASDEDWTYTWKGLDDRLQYYVLEYYTKKKPNGEVIYNDRGEARKVLIGGTMPIFSTMPTSGEYFDKYYSKGVYGFTTKLGDYPEAIEFELPNGTKEMRIPIQVFNENETHPSDPAKEHANSITKKEKLESVDNNARQYIVSYKLSREKDAGGKVKTNIIELTNSQVFDDRTYYVWLDHETKLPEMIAQTYVEDGEKKSHPVALVADTEHKLEDGSYCVKGLSVSSVDSASSNAESSPNGSAIVEGNATNAFRVKEADENYAWFTATNHGNYLTGTGTRTYQVKYVVEATSKAPVSVSVDGQGNLVKTGTTTKVEGDNNYIVYSWFMTIHVYNVKADDVIEYDPDEGSVVLQEALESNKELKWTLKHDGSNYNAIEYTSDDTRDAGILSNDIYRVPLYKSAEDPNMGSCADLVAIAYSEDGILSSDSDVKKLEFEDTYDFRYGNHDEESPVFKQDGKALAQGSGGYVEVDLKTLRNHKINRIQDHVNYASVTFNPNKLGRARGVNGEDVFYYKIVVFAEDNTYQYYKYDDIDASEGVVMYTYFTMKPKTKPEEPKDPTKPTSPTKPTIIPKDGKDPGVSDAVWSTDYKEESSESTLNVTSDNTAGIKLAGTTPKTSDDNNLLLWFSIVALATALIVIGILLRNNSANIKMPNTYGWIICFTGSAILVFSGGMLVRQLVDYKSSSSLYDNTVKEYVTSKPESEIEEDESNVEELVDVDIDKLCEVNDDIVGWIYFENEDISYPVLHADDNVTYLRRTYTGKKSSAGSIFMEACNENDFSDAHTIIYGHNMKNLSMFGKLKFYLEDSSYINDHKYFQIITENNKYRYRIFSYKVVSEDSDIYTVYKDGSQYFEDFVKDVIQKDNCMNADEDISYDDHLITLSTCFNDNRLVVTAVRCDEEWRNGQSPYTL